MLEGDEVAFTVLRLGVAKATAVGGVVGTPAFMLAFNGVDGAAKKKEDKKS